MSTVHHSECPVCSNQSFQTIFNGKDHSHTGESFEVIQCQKCHFVLTQDAPDAEHIGPYYQSEDYVSHSDTQKGLFFKVYHKVRDYMLGQKAQMVEAHAQQGNLLDIGTGTGYFPGTMKQRGWKVTGIEQDENARKYASEKFDVEVKEPKAIQELEDKSYDAITLWHVLEHIHDLNNSISEMKRVLKDKGCLLIAVPNHDSHDARYYGSYWAAWDLPIHLWHFTPFTMEQLMARHGMSIVQHYKLPFDSFYVSLLSAKYKKSNKIKALFVGLASWMKSLSNAKKCSSVVYVIKKNS